MRVALLTYSARAGDAIGNSVAAKAAFFQERGAEVRVFAECDQALHPALRGLCQVVPAADPHGEWWRFVSGADLVSAEYGQAYGLLGVLPLLAGGRPRILLDYHGVTPPDLWGPHNREALVQGLEQRGLSWCADGVLVHSRYTERELRAECGLAADRLHRLGFPVELDYWQAGPGGQDLRQRLGLEGASLLLFVGRLAPNKRAPLLVEALGRLRHLSPPVHALIVGDTSDLYRAQADLCRQRATALGVADRLHVLDHLTGDALRAAYHAADVLVVPSLWESFCIPVVEAMAAGVPVVASRAAALPETVGDAGLTFAPDDVDDLVRQLRRVVQGARGSLAGEGAESSVLGTRHSVLSPPTPRRIAIVVPRYGDSLGSGVERSLRVIAETLHAAGHDIEILTTCVRSEGGWANELPPGPAEVGGLRVQRFPLEAADRTAYQAAYQEITQAGGRVGPELGRRFLAQLPSSSALVKALVARRERLDAVLVGPYLSGLTLAVARTLPEKTLLLPCFHDEPLARLAGWRAAYEPVAGVLYHSDEERDLAQADLGLNHPFATVIGTYLAAPAPSKQLRRIFLAPAEGPRSGEHGYEVGPRSGEHGYEVGSRVRQNAGCQTNSGDLLSQRPSPVEGRYVLYCGRYLREKGVATLVEYGRRYSAQHPGRFTFVFAGQGDVAIPREPWALDLGFVSEADKRGLLAGAAVLVQLSRNESLSLVALEAWAEGTPVLADQACAVLAGHVRRCGGGAVVAGYDEFAHALDDLWQGPERWREQGRQGRAYVHSTYGSRPAFLGRLEEALASLGRPLPDQMRLRGRERARQFAAPAWRQEFGRIVEQMLHGPPRPYRHLVEVRRRAETRTVRPGTPSLLAAVRVVNWGTHAGVAEGPGRTVLRCQVVDDEGREVALPAGDTPLPGLIMPGRSRAAVVAVPVPGTPGVYRVDLWAAVVRDADSTATNRPSPPFLTSFRLVVAGEGAEAGGTCCGPLLEATASDLADAQRLQRLPDEYLDVTEGLLAGLKRRLKQKLLGNFKQGYVDVLSRQQSAFNRQMLAAVQELAECCATLDHAVRLLHQRGGRASKRKAGRRRGNQQGEVRP